MNSIRQSAVKRRQSHVYQDADRDAHEVQRRYPRRQRVGVIENVLETAQESEVDDEDEDKVETEEDHDWF
jgi:hypothetical protein